MPLNTLISRTRSVSDSDAELRERESRRRRRSGKRNSVVWNTAHVQSTESLWSKTPVYRSISQLSTSDYGSVGVPSSHEPVCTHSIVRDVFDAECSLVSLSLSAFFYLTALGSTSRRWPCMFLNAVVLVPIFICVTGVLSFWVALFVLVGRVLFNEDLSHQSQQLTNQHKEQQMRTESLSSATSTISSYASNESLLMGSLGAAHNGTLLVSTQTNNGTCVGNSPNGDKHNVPLKGTSTTPMFYFKSTVKSFYPIRRRS